MDTPPAPTAAQHPPPPPPRPAKSPQIFLSTNTVQYRAMPLRADRFNLNLTQNLQYSFPSPPPPRYLSQVKRAHLARTPFVLPPPSSPPPHSAMSVTLHTTKGDIKLELHCREVPRSCANFLALCASGVYTGCLFHRVSRGFMVQTGDPSGTGKTSRAAFAKRLPDEMVPSLTFARAGVVAFANNGRPSRKGVGSQFFITVQAAAHLDASCTVVGSVIWGLGVVKEISEVEAEEGRPCEEVRVEAVTVHANPFATGDLQYELS